MASIDLSKLSLAPERTYLKWDTVETVPADEQATIDKVVKQINLIQAAQAMKVKESDEKPYTFTGTHARTHGIVKGTMTIATDLPAHLAQSMFAVGGKTYPLAMRYSSEPGVPALCDKIPQPRGLGIKVFGLEAFGDKLDGLNDVHTQDLEFNSCSILELGSAKTAYEIIDLRIKHGKAEDLSNALDEREDGPIQQIRNRMKNQRLEAQKMYSQSSFRFGDNVVKMCVVPTGALQEELAHITVTPEHPSTILWLESFFATNAGTYDLRVQLCENLEEQPVEDSRYEWDEVKYPFVTVATINIPSQETRNVDRQNFWQDKMRVSPWSGLLTLQPLGSINRTRKDVYAASFAFRHKANGHEEIIVRDIAQIP